MIAIVTIMLWFQQRDVVERAFACGRVEATMERRDMYKYRDILEKRYLYLGCDAIQDIIIYNRSIQTKSKLKGNNL
jgi:hypothetical protein